ncbi:MAG TPA: glycosyltransferase family 39 protein [Dehalococcoidia bacterium]|nr:glycosyltransferase family 39 protein [Dehalococcoidia bacterium]
MAWLPMEYLLSHAVPDDAFYYFQTARNIVHGRGVSVDGEVWANGFHPLWLLTILPVFATFRGDAETPIHVSLTLSALAVSGSGPLLFLLARRLGLDVVPSLAVTSLYLFHPLILLMSVNGLETGLNLALFVVTLYFFVRAHQEPSIGTYAAMSAAGGLLVLSRTDYGIVVAAMMLWLLWRSRSERCVASVAALGIPALLVTLPWFAWSQVTFGSPVQVSAGAVPYVAHRWPNASDASLVEDMLESVRRVREAVVETVPSLYLGPNLEMAWMGVLLVVGLLLAALLLPWRNARANTLRLGILAAPFAGLLLQLAIHTGVRWYLREWYVLPLLVIVLLLMGHVVEELRHVRFGHVAALALLATFMALFLPRAVNAYREGWYPVQLDMLTAARWIDANTPPQTRVGAFNSGIVGYYSERVTVNLDGVMNPEAVEAIRDRRLAAYIREKDLDLLVDYPFYPFWFYAPFLGGRLQERQLAAFNAHPSFQGPYTVWSVSPVPE